MNDEKEIKSQERESNLETINKEINNNLDSIDSSINSFIDKIELKDLLIIGLIIIILS